MVLIQSLIVLGLISSFYFGQLARFQTAYFSFPIIDIFIILFAATNLINNHKIVNKAFVYFILFAWFSLFFHGIPTPVSISYLVRLTAIISLFIFPPHKKYSQLLTIAVIANIIFGLIQYFIWPDLTYFKAIGWDDHLYRLVSTYMDPTFTGLIYLLLLIHLFLHKKSKFLIILTLIALFLTYSRSTFLSLIICGLFLAIQKSQSKIFLTAFIIVFTSILLLPRLSGEGTKLERTSSINAKLINYRQGINQFIKAPLIGIGYNNLVTANSRSHSTSGYDSSLLTILVTTGVIGLALFGMGFFYLFQSSSLEIKTMLVAIFVHSLFANSLLYPFTLIFLVII